MLTARRDGQNIVVRNEGGSVARDVQVVPGAVVRATLEPGESFVIEGTLGITLVKYMNAIDEFVDVPVA